MSYEDYIASKKRNYLELGLTEQEFDILTAPLSQLTSEQKAIAIGVKEKLTGLIEAANKAGKIDKDLEQSKKEFADKFKGQFIVAKTVL